VPLNPNRRAIARSLARLSWMQAEGDLETAEILFRGNPRLVGLSPLMISLLMLLAQAFWKYWISRNIIEPSVVASMDELQTVGISEDDDA